MGWDIDRHKSGGGKESQVTIFFFFPKREKGTILEPLLWPRVEVGVLTTCAMVCAASYALLTGDMNSGLVGRVVSTVPCESHLLL